MIPLPYRMKPSPAILLRIVIPGVLCAMLLAPAAMQRHWPAAAVVGCIVLLSLLAACYRASRRIVLNEAGIQFSGLAKPGLLVSYADIEGLDILPGARRGYLIVQTSPLPIRVPFEPFGPSEWAKFVSVVASRSPHATMSPRVKQMFES